MENFENNAQKLKTGFKVPEGYFETLESKIMDKVLAEPQPKVKFLFPKKIIGFAVAASLVLSASLIFWPSEKEKQQELAQETLQNYLETENLNEYLLTDMLTDEDLKSMEVLHGIDKDEIEVYLEKTIDDESYYYN
ncbi:MAG: hypothetical protein ACOVLC_08370 [Flavobacterium sp.]